MNRKKKVARNIVILLILSIITFTRSLYLTPLAAHEASERSIHYGPSKVVHIEDFDQGKYLISKYDKWISCNTVNRSMFFFWTFGDQVTGIEVDKDKPLNFSYGSGDNVGKFYGIINDKSINRVELYLEDGRTLAQTEFYDGDMFLFTWDVDNNKQWYNGIRAYDFQGNLIYEEDIR